VFVTSVEFCGEQEALNLAKGEAVVSLALADLAIIGLFDLPQIGLSAGNKQAPY
jgi:hypothetical protein